jgi:hypothetical protein
LHTLDKNIENGVEYLPQIDFTRTTSRFCGRKQVAEKLVLITTQVARVSFTHMPLSVLWTIYLQLIPSGLFYALTHFSNTL